MNRTKFILPVIAISVILFTTILVLLFAFNVGQASANPFYTGSKAQSAVASSTQMYIAPGTATTSVIYDSYEQFGTNQQNTGNITIPDTVAVVLDGISTSSPATVNVACEFSDNYNGQTGNGDWYQNEIYPATTTGAQAIGQPVTFSMLFSSSTLGGIGNGSRFQKLFLCPVPTRYVRAIITVTGAPVSIWAQFIPKKQRN